jgi:hypothetical protein
MTDNHEALAASRRLDSTTKAARVLAAINAITATGTPLNIAALARTAKVSRRFIYDHPELRAEAEQQAAGIAERDGIALTANARVTAASLRADLANARAANQRLQAELAALRRCLGRHLGQDVLAEIVGDKDTQLGALIGPRVQQLEHRLFEVQEELAQRTEELEAARQINRELLERLNRRPPT